jgi:hypothetical protein
VMKRTFIKGILSASVVTACLAAGCSSHVYSTNSMRPMASEPSGIWQVGPFEIGEFHYWPNGNGYELDGNYVGEPVQISTYFKIDSHTVTVPLSPKRAASVGATVLLGLGGILSGLVAKKSLRSAASEGHCPKGL